MKKITLAVIGKIKEAYFEQAIGEYKKRLSRYCDLEIREFSDNGIEKESNNLIQLKSIDFLFDIDGEMVSSPDLSQLLQREFLIKDNVVFVIGGSNGVNQEVKNKAKKRISFGKITYPHQLMRVIALEQIYRSFTILNNLPYHK